MKQVWNFWSYPAATTSLATMHVKARQDAPPLSEGRKAEIEQLDILICKTMKTCMKGSTRNKKGSPAFGHLSLLVSVRERLLRGHQPGKESDGDFIARAEKMLAEGKAK